MIFFEKYYILCEVNFNNWLDQREASKGWKGDTPQCDWTNTEIRVKYEKLKLHDLFNRSMEIVFQKIQKWGI